MRSWRSALAELRRCAEADGDIGRVARGLFSPASWDSTSMVEHLELATSPVRMRLEKHTRPARALTAALAKHGGAAALGAVPKLQAKLYQFYLSEMYPNDIPGLAARRLTLYGHGVEQRRLDQVLNATKRFAPEVAWAVVLSLLCSWITSRRMQDVTQQPCVFGCWGRISGTVKRDEFSHYLVCPRLAHVIVQAAPGEAGNLSSWLLPPCGTGSTERNRLARRVAAALHVHRTLRLTKELYTNESLQGRTMRQHLELLVGICKSAAHKFGIARCDKFASTR